MTTDDRRSPPPDPPSPGGSAPAAGPWRERVRAGLRALLGAVMLLVGVLHFLTPEPFVKMVPAALPSPLLLVHLSGVAEIAGGAGLFIPRVRRAASWGLIALYVSVFPANVNMALNHIPLGDLQLTTFQLWARLPLQVVFIAWAWWVGRDGRART